MIKALLTEKTLSLAKGVNQYTFLVTPGLTKDQIKGLVSNTFGVHVQSVQTRNVAGKAKKVGKKRKLTVGSHYKKAIVTLKNKEKIDLFEVEKK